MEDFYFNSVTERYKAARSWLNRMYYLSSLQNMDISVHNKLRAAILFNILYNRIIFIKENYKKNKDNNIYPKCFLFEKPNIN